MWLSHNLLLLFVRFSVYLFVCQQPIGFLFFSANKPSSNVVGYIILYKQPKSAFPLSKTKTNGGEDASEVQKQQHQKCSF
eukprot:m.197020 g.197020  ORF g.197020 m.197020 type:complete len:80 (+) comp16823_c0_seq1:2498-2737(+)